MRNQPCLFACILCSGMLLAGCGDNNSRPVSRGGAPAGAPVEAVVVQPQLLENRIYSTGTLLANEKVELRSEISGRVTGVLFAEGSHVHKGALLLKINDQELQAQLKRKEYEQALAADEERRQRALLDINGISRETYDKSNNNLKMIEAERELLETQIAKTSIVAPFDGLIGLRYVSEGGYVTPSVLISTMQDTDPMKVEFSVPEKNARQIKNGTPILVQIGDSPETNKGVVYAVESMIDPGTRTMKARATIPNPDGTLIPGSFGKVEVTLERIPDAIVIPSGALIPRINDEIVYVCRSGKARSISVKSGIRTESGTQITQGLAPGDTLIVSGLLQLTDGKDIQITALQGN
ncbi:MAG: efflux RND transporter periplasmic adaptor subunit [candidate division Zixibacteria bacterium]|nr:efflux RND transporter periplasmic adaptor subunit [candidate division Zixibacteria bacterium]